MARTFQRFTVVVRGPDGAAVRAQMTKWLSENPDQWPPGSRDKQRNSRWFARKLCEEGWHRRDTQSEVLLFHPDMTSDQHLVQSAGNGSPSIEADEIRDLPALTGKTRVSREKEWVAALIPALSEGLDSERGLKVVAGFRLPYRHEIHAYRDKGIVPAPAKIAGYQTDLLIFETIDGGWIPRVVVECKLGAVTTHDALTYSAKAATHKHVHPYLRYGILIGELSYVPTRLIHHGTQFDFMAAWPDEKPTTAGWKVFLNVLREEVAASRTLGSLMGGGRSANPPTLFHRRLVLTETV